MKFFPSKIDAVPTIYAYEDNHPNYLGLLKVGYTTGDAKKRVAQQYPTKRPGGAPYKIHFEESAMRKDGTSFTDHDIHRYLRKKGFRNPDGEWFECTVKDIQAAVIALQTNQLNEESRTQTFGMRPEQREAVQKAVDYFESYKDEKDSITDILIEKHRNGAVGSIQLLFDGKTTSFLSMDKDHAGMPIANKATSFDDF